MRIFTGQYERTIDDKHRIQLPSQVRTVMEPEGNSRGLYITLGEHPHTLSLFTLRRFEELADQMETEFMSGTEALQFELQFYGNASFTEPDKQGRIILPNMLRRKARLAGDVVLVGQKHRLDIWDAGRLNQAMGMNWEGDDWPNWHRFLRMKPDQPDRS